MWHKWLAELLISSAAYDHVFISFLPNRDRDGKELDVDPWETKALEIRGSLFRGATSYPSRGSYRKSDGTSGVMQEKTRMIVSFVGRADLSRDALEEITTFLREFGESTNQETVAFALDGELYYIDILREKGRRK